MDFRVNAPGSGPAISSMNPNPVPGLNANQAVTINGSGFVSGSGLRVQVVTGSFSTDLTGSQVTWLSASQLSIQINVGTTTANWTAQVVNPDGRASNIFSFFVTAGTGACVSTVAADHWKGEYYGNMALNGNAIMVRDEGVGNLPFDWGGGSPSAACGVPQDLFSVRWTRTVTFNAGSYRLKATADDGIRVWVDGYLKIDQWRDQGATDYTADLNLSAGAHIIKVEYYENGGGAVAKLSWEALTTAGGPHVDTVSPNPVTGSNSVQTITIMDPNGLSNEAANDSRNGVHERCMCAFDWVSRECRQLRPMHSCSSA